MSIQFITGAVASGKSAHALSIARHFSPKRLFVATGEALDGEMTAKIERHRQERGEDFVTLEEPLFLARALREAPAANVVVVDSLSFWVSNCLLQKGEEFYEKEQQELLTFLLESLTDPPVYVFVSDEVGWGGISVDRLTRKFQNMLGNLNQHIAAMADKVILNACGYPMLLKGKPF